MRRASVLLLLAILVTGCSGDSSQGTESDPPSRLAARNFVSELIRDSDGTPKALDCGRFREETISCDARWTRPDGAECENTFEVKGSDTSLSLTSDWKAICLVPQTETITDISDLLGP
jgi:hypothetical protein